jgi:predicted TIM-barrel enzyme
MEDRMTSTLKEFFDVQKPVIVGSSLEVDGKTWNPVVPERVKACLEMVRDGRGHFS